MPSIDFSVGYRRCECAHERERDSLRLTRIRAPAKATNSTIFLHIFVLKRLSRELRMGRAARANRVIATYDVHGADYLVCNVLWNGNRLSKNDYERPRQQQIHKRLDKHIFYNSKVSLHRTNKANCHCIVVRFVLLSINRFREWEAAANPFDTVT